MLLIGERPAMYDVGQLPLERPQRLHAAVAFGELPVVVRASGSAAADLGAGSGVQHLVRLPVAAARQAVAASPEDASRGAVPVNAGDVCLVGKRETSSTIDRMVAAPTSPMPWMWVSVVADAASGSHRLRLAAGCADPAHGCRPAAHGR